MDHPEAVTLDLFGTLVDLDVHRDEPPLVAGLLEARGHEADPEAVLTSWLEESLRRRAATPFRRVRETLIDGARQAASTHGLDIDPQRWADELESLWASAPLHPDVPEALSRIEGEALPWAIVTNVDEHVLDRLLENTGLDGRVPVVITSERARAYKPHPRPFRMALDRLEVPAAKAIHVGDRASEDRAGARATGMSSALVDRAAGPQLDAVLDRILGTS